MADAKMKQDTLAEQKRVGGDAFPSNGYAHGMTLLDFFAAHAMQGLIVGQGDVSDSKLPVWDDWDELAEAAYHLGAAMIEARKNSVEQKEEREKRKTALEQNFNEWKKKVEELLLRDQVPRQKIIDCEIMHFRDLWNSEMDPETAAGMLYGKIKNQ